MSGRWLPNEVKLPALKGGVLPYGSASRRGADRSRPPECVQNVI